MSTHSEIVPLRTLAKRLPKLNYLRNDRQNLKQLDPENEAKARLKLAIVFCFLRRQGGCRRAHTRILNFARDAHRFRRAAAWTDASLESFGTFLSRWRGDMLYLRRSLC
jgi:hypothetical protein